MPGASALVSSMTDNPERAIETMRERLKGGEYEISEADREALLDLSDEIRLQGPSQYSDQRHVFLLRRGLKMAEAVGGLADAVEDRDAAESIVGWINSEQTGSPETNKDYRVALRNIGNILTPGDELPESVEWVPGGYPKNYDPAPAPEEMLKWDAEVQPMLDACLNARDRALVALAFDLGPRPGELFALTPRAISDHKYGKQATVEGKTGRRSPVLIPSVPYVQKWLDVHPGAEGDPLWCGLKTGGPITNNRVRDALKDVADRAGVTKAVTPTNFRKSSASFLASQGVSQAHLEDHHGWTRGSAVAARYIAVFDDANEREIAKAHGLDVTEDEPEDTGPVICPRCDQKTPRSEDLCVWCDYALSQSAAEQLEDADQTLVESVAEAAADVDDVAPDDVVEARKVINDNPALKRILLSD